MGLDIRNLDQFVQRYCHLVLADATRWSYGTAANHSLTSVICTTLPISFQYWKLYLAIMQPSLVTKVLAPYTICSYLSALLIFQVLLVLWIPEITHPTYTSASLLRYRQGKKQAFGQQSELQQTASPYHTNNSFSDLSPVGNSRVKP